MGWKFPFWRPAGPDALPNNFVWSDLDDGREFQRNDPLPFSKVADLGGTSTAKIDSVKCRGVLLARKQIFWTRRIPRDEIRREITILKRLDHHHVVKYIGSYTQSKTVAILLHPAADYDLGQFLRMVDDEKVPGKPPLPGPYADLLLAFGCLASGLKYLHANGVKHKDIKPSNILWHHGRYVYIDFGTSTEIKHHMESGTTGPTAHTELYCAPEVKNYHLGTPRGRAADIFSLGCVFAEVLTAMSSLTTHDFYDMRVDDGSHAYYRNIKKTCDWLDACWPPYNAQVQDRSPEQLRGLIQLTNHMLRRRPDFRPHAATLVDYLSSYNSTQARLFCEDCLGFGWKPELCLEIAFFDKMDNIYKRIESVPKVPVPSSVARIIVFVVCYSYFVLRKDEFSQYCTLVLYLCTMLHMLLSRTITASALWLLQLCAMGAVYYFNVRPGALEIQKLRDYDANRL